MITTWNPQAVVLVSITVQEGFGYYLVNLMHNAVRNCWINQKGEVNLAFPLICLFVQFFVESIKNLQFVILFKILIY